MFVVDAAVLLPHPPHAVARVVGRLHLLPRWCAGLRRVRFPPPTPGGPAASGVADGHPDVDGPDAPDRACVFTYAAPDVRLTLHARTAVASAGAALRAAAARPMSLAEAAPAGVAPARFTHTATGEGLTLAWTFVVEPNGASAEAAHTLLGVHVEVQVDPAHPLAAARAALCRVVARRVPTDLERLRILLDRYEGARVRLRRPSALPLSDPPPRIAR